MSKIGMIIMVLALGFLVGGCSDQVNGIILSDSGTELILAAVSAIVAFFLRNEIVKKFRMEKGLLLLNPPSVEFMKSTCGFVSKLMKMEN